MRYPYPVVHGFLWQTPLIELTQYFIEDHHKPIIEKADWKLVQQIIKEKRYRKRKGQRNRKPKFIVKGPLAGFFIIDPTWDEQDVEEIIARSSNTTQPLSPDNIEEDGDFYIEKE